MSPAPLEDRVGSLLAGRYRLEGVLGTGGTAVVYRATHAWTGRSVAVKLLRPELSRDRGLVTRFLREARAASTLVHPNVVAILDMGTDADGEVYIAMELVEGESLGAILDREGHLAPERALAILRPILGALSLAHRSGIVHRDIKPDNIIVGDRGDGIVRPILLDFGTAKSTDAAWGSSTQVGTIVGTPFYMSPEQTEGAADLGTASDVWSMGVLLYRCLSGALPFFASSPPSLLLAIVRGDHVPLEVRAPSVPRALASVVERALRVDCSERYTSAAEMLEAIDRAVEGRIDTSLAALPARASSIDPSSRDTAARHTASRHTTSGQTTSRRSIAPRRPRVGRAIAAAATAATLLCAIGLGSIAALGSSDPLAPSSARAETTLPASVPVPPEVPLGVDPPAAMLEPGIVAAGVVTTDLEGPAAQTRLTDRPRTLARTHSPSIDGASIPSVASAPPRERTRRSLTRATEDRPARATGLATEW